MRRKSFQSSRFDFLAQEKGSISMKKTLQILRARLLPVLCSLIALTLASCGGTQGLPYGNDGLLTGDSQDNGLPPVAPTEAAAQTEQIARDIEEADVVKVTDDRVYVLNRYK